MTSLPSSPDTTGYFVPAARFSLTGAVPAAYRAMTAFYRSVELDQRLRHLLDVRVSQINGCAFCLDMHLREAREHGESTQRLDTLAGWRESPFFTAAERSALALAEALTRIADVGSVPDVVHDEAARHFDDETIARIAFAVAAINSWNRLVLASQTLPPAR